MSEQSVLVSREGAVMTVTLNRPERLNAMTAELLDRAVSVLSDAANDDSRMTKNRRIVERRVSVEFRICRLMDCVFVRV